MRDKVPETEESVANFLLRLSRDNSAFRSHWTGPNTSPVGLSRADYDRLFQLAQAGQAFAESVAIFRGEK